MVSIQGLCKNYGDFTSLDHLDLEIEKGELFGFVGPNGAGKTTMMRIVAGLLPADGGKVVVDGIDAIHDSVHLKEKIGYMPDFFGVYDNLQVMEYMKFYASVYGITGETAHRLCKELLEMVHLNHKAGDMVDGLSRGMKQRLCLARCLIHSPEVLILDEPVSGLDPQARRDIKVLLSSLHKTGKTIIISSHILSELSELCSTIGIIEKGRMLVKGSLEEITRQVNASNPIIVTVADQKEKAVELLKGLPEVASISIDADRIIVGFEGEREEQAMLLQRMVSAGVPVVSFYRRAGSLEAVFMKAIGRTGGI